MSIFKACDIRAPYGTELLDRHATLLGQAIALLRGPTDVLVGGDARQSTPRLKELLVASLEAAGCRIVDVGTVPTPVFYFARARLGIDTAVMVTASHNPADHNGFKLTLGPLPVTEDEIARLRELMENGARAPAALGERAEADVVPEYLEFVGALLPERHDLRVVVDYGHGVAALTGPSLWPGRADPVELFATVDGLFPGRSPNPAVASNLTALRAAVTSHGADLGVAYDGDADRVALVDELGEVVANDKVIALFARQLLQDGPAAVVYDQKCSRVVAQTVSSFGGEAIMEKSGHTFIKTTFLERAAVYAGELSGHHFFRSLPQGDDGVFASLLFAKLLASSGRPLSRLASELPDYPITPDIRLPVAPGEAERIVAELEAGLIGEARLSKLDGVRAEFSDGWGLARKSVTEPLVTLRFEGDDSAALERIMTRFEVAAPALAGAFPGRAEVAATELVIGVDVGTQGVRVLAVDGSGEVWAASSRPLPAPAANLPIGWSEQDPRDWWAATRLCLAEAVSQIEDRGHSAGEVTALAVDSTSGTILPVDGTGEPLHAALMYNDSRSAPLLAEVREAGRELEAKLGYTFQSSFALAKIVWLCRHDPSLLERTTRFIHAADYLHGRLTGDFTVSDHSNALKTGFDLLAYAWPAFIERELGVPLAKLPRVVAPGDPIGTVSPRAAAETGLSPATRVVAGMTDGSAAQLASGATAIGAWNSILGTTLVIKGIARELIRDPLGRVYCHLHPQGSWMPGGASNTGAEWIPMHHPGSDPARLDAAAAPYLPSGLIRYPLARRGERFPFVAPDAEGFTVGEPENEFERYAAGLEGLAYLEMLAYATLEDLGAEVGEVIHVTGGGARSRVWLEVRASVLNRQLVRPLVSETAMGAALLAASGALYPNLAEASRQMVKPDLRIDPRADWLEPYQDRYQRFVAACRERGYVG